MTTANTAQATSRPHPSDDMRRLLHGLQSIASLANLSKPDAGTHYHDFHDIAMRAEQLQVLVPAGSTAAGARYAGEDARLLGNLLAVIHRDGGHHQQRVGTAQAVADAGQIFHSLAVTAGLRAIPTALPDDTDGHGLTRRSADRTLMAVAESVAVRLGRIDIGRMDRGTIEAVVLGALKDWETSLLPRPSDALRPGAKR